MKTVSFYKSNYFFNLLKFNALIFLVMVLSYNATAYGDWSPHTTICYGSQVYLTACPFQTPNYCDSTYARMIAGPLRIAWYYFDNSFNQHDMFTGSTTLTFHLVTDLPPAGHGSLSGSPFSDHTMVPFGPNTVGYFSWISPIIIPGDPGYEFVAGDNTHYLISTFQWDGGDFGGQAYDPIVQGKIVPGYQATNVSCTGSNTGALTETSIQGGSQNFVGFNWSNGAITQNVSNLCAGNYTVTVTDDRGCTGTRCFNIYTYGCRWLPAGSDCYGTQIHLFACPTPGGVDYCAYSDESKNLNLEVAWSYLDNSFQMHDMLDPSAPVGTLVYHHLTDAYPPAGRPARGGDWLSPEIIPGDPGYEYIAGSGGNNYLFLSFRWDEDYFGAQSYNPEIYPAIKVPGTPQNVSCNGPCNGSVTITPNGGSGVYTAFLWSNGAITQNVPNLCAGNYTVTVTDDRGCTGTTCFNIYIYGCNWFPPGANCYGTQIQLFTCPIIGPVDYCAYPDADKNANLRIAWYYYDDTFQYHDMLDPSAPTGTLVYHHLTDAYPPSARPMRGGDWLSPVIIPGDPGYEFIAGNSAHYLYCSYQWDDSEFGGKAYNPEILPLCQNINVQNEDVNYVKCYNAALTIYVAGLPPANPTTFYVENGGNVTMIAGQNIIYYPGTRVFPGGYLWGYIAPGGPWCGTTVAPITASPPETKSETETETRVYPVPEKSFFSIYPNPTTGGFSLQLQGIDEASELRVEIYEMKGEQVVSADVKGQRKYDFSLEGKPAGIYFIRVVSGKYAGTGKIIKE